VTAVAAAEPVRVRPLLPGDVDAVVSMVCAQEFTEGFARETIRRSFDYPWTPERPHSGFVLQAGDRIVGCLGVIFSSRLRAGREERYGNTTTWYVEPSHRRYGLQLLTAAMQLEGVTLLTLSASEVAAAVLERLGFQVVSRRALFFGPLSGPFAASLRTRIRTSPAELEERLPPEHLRILRDHRPFACGHYLVEEGGRSCYVVTARWREKGWFLPAAAPARLRLHQWRVSRVLYVSDPELARRHWLALRWRMMIRERSVGVVVPEALLGPNPPEARATPRRFHAYRRGGAPAPADALYSELVFQAG
jgi:hypothetical protein